MFSNHRLEILDHLEADVVLFIAEIHEGAGVNAVIREEDFDGSVGIDRSPRCGLSFTRA